MLSELSILTISSILSWVAATIPLYLASRLMVGKRSTLLRSLFATLLGLTFFSIPEIIVLVPTPGAIIFSAFAGIIALIILSFLYGTIFNTSVGGGFVITVAAVVLSILIFILLAVVLGLSLTLLHPAAVILELFSQPLAI